MSCPSSIRRRDSNPRSLERESPPITTRPGLPAYCIVYLLRYPYRVLFCGCNCFYHVHQLGLFYFNLDIFEMRTFCDKIALDHSARDYARLLD